MQNRVKFTPYFLIVLSISLLIFVFSKTPLFVPMNSFFHTVFSPIDSFTYNIYSNSFNGFGNSKYNALTDENIALEKKLVDQNKLIADNKALLDQFQTQNPKSTSLIPANVIGAPNFIPGISVPEGLIIDRGEDDGIKIGDAVVYKDNLIGKINKISKNVSEVMLITSSAFSFTVKTLETKSLGIAKGQGGGEIILDNVLLSDNLKKGDVVVTKGDINDKGEGLAPNLVVGKIQSINKNPSDLFQKAEIQTGIDVTRLQKVFVIQN